MLAIVVGAAALVVGKATKDYRGEARPATDGAVAARVAPPRRPAFRAVGGLLTAVSRWSAYRSASRYPEHHRRRGGLWLGTDADECF